jgi:hypothetical protein
MGISITVTISGIPNISGDAVKAAISKGMSEAVKVGQGLAKQHASFSSRISGSVKGSGSGTKGVITAGCFPPPAGGYENPGGFYHPYFGHGRVHNPGHPYMAPAAEALKGQLSGIFESALSGIF